MEPKNIKYKIRDIATSLYQGTKFNKWTGDVEWSKKGKTWAELEELKIHLKHLEESRIQLSPLWEIVEIEKRKEISCYPASIFSTKKKSLI